jgi:hypothetical protein
MSPFQNLSGDGEEPCFRTFSLLIELSTRMVVKDAVDEKESKAGNTLYWELLPSLSCSKRVERLSGDRSYARTLQHELQLHSLYSAAYFREYNIYFL